MRQRALGTRQRVRGRPFRIKVVRMATGAIHKARRIIRPRNIPPVFTPPYSPQLNPAEKIWWRSERACSDQAFAQLDHRSGYIADQGNALNNHWIRSIRGSEHIAQAGPFGRSFVAEWH